MRLSIILFLIFISVADCFCQNRNSVWCFGDSAGIDFSSGVPIPIVTSLDTRGSCVSIADSNGNLLFYAAYDSTSIIAGTDPVKVYDSSNNIMLNGDSIKGGGWYRELVITSNPANSNEYFVFNIGVTFDYGFYYSIVDMNQNGGLGAVTQKNVQLQTFKCSDGLAAIKHGNGRDWWVFFRRWDTVNDEFYKYLVTPSGISNPIIQNIGSATGNGFAKIRFSPDGSKMALITYTGLIELYDFDRCAGDLSNTFTINPEVSTAPYPNFWSAEFSPNGRFLYITTYKDTCYLYQYDLQSSNPASTRITLDTTTNYLIALGNVRLAPNGKIYMSYAYECAAFPFCYPYPDSVYNYVNMNLSVINYPDSLGTACGYAPFSFYLGGHRAYYGLPNNPDYDMSRLQGSACDTIQWTGVQNIKQPKGLMYVTYISGWQKLFVNAQGLKGRSFKMSVYDMVGNVVYTEEGASTSLSMTHSGYFTKDINMAAFAKGMYIVNFVTDKERLVKKFIKD